MNKQQKALLFFILVGVFILVYSPHFFYGWPFHIDEWKHIAEAQRLYNVKAYFDFIGPEISSRFSGFEIGFHFWLFIISLFSNLVDVYKFLPAVWAVFSSVTLFFLVYKKTNNNFNVASLSVIFFASIKSNVNLLGLWFYTPLSFSIPFIFLYMYFFSFGVEENNKKYIYVSIAIMFLLLFFHPLSVLFSIPIIIIYSLINYKYIIKEWKSFSFLFITGLLGILFFSTILKLSPPRVLPELINNLIFKKGWGMLELNNPLSSIYNWLALILSFFGIFVIYYQKKIKEYYFFILWPLILFISICFYRIFGFSLITPFQRNLYYLAISLPILSAIGLDFLINKIKIGFNKYLNNFKNASNDYKKMLEEVLLSFVFIAIFGVIFWNYYFLPKEVRGYVLINDNDYQSIVYTKQFSPSNIMTTLNFGSVLFALSGNNPVAALNFYGDRSVVQKFSKTKDCDIKKEILISSKVDYILWNQPIDCDFLELIKKFDNNYIYKFIY